MLSCPPAHTSPTFILHPPPALIGGSLLLYITAIFTSSVMSCNFISFPQTTLFGPSSLHPIFFFPFMTEFTSELIHLYCPLRSLCEMSRSLCPCFPMTSSSVLRGFIVTEYTNPGLLWEPLHQMPSKNLFLPSSWSFTGEIAPCLISGVCVWMNVCVSCWSAYYLSNNNKISHGPAHSDGRDKGNLSRTKNRCRWKCSFAGILLNESASREPNRYYPIISSPAAVIGLAEDHTILSLSGDGHILNAGTSRDR